MFQRLRQLFSRSKPTPMPASMRAVPESELKERYRQSVRHYAYGSILLALGTKLAKADDGSVNDAEIGRVSSMIQQLQEPETLLQEAQNDNMPMDHYVKRLTTFFPDNRRLFHELMDQLFDLAQCDGPLNATEIDYLHSISEALGVDDGYMMRKLKGAIVPKATDPYVMLDVSKNASREDIKQAYHKAMAAYHPDRITCENYNGVIKEYASQRMTLLAEAYEAIKAQKRRRA